MDINGYLLYDVVKKCCFCGSLDLRSKKTTSPDHGYLGYLGYLSRCWNWSIKTSTNSTLFAPDHATQSAMRKVPPPAAAILPCRKVVINEIFGQGEYTCCSFGSARGVGHVEISDSQTGGLESSKMMKLVRACKGVAGWSTKEWLLLNLGLQWQIDQDCCHRVYNKIKTYGICHCHCNDCIQS